MMQFQKTKWMRCILIVLLFGCIYFIAVTTKGSLTSDEACPITFEKGTHYRDKDSIRTYPELTTTDEYGFYSIEVAAVTEEEQATAVVKRIEEDIRKAQALLPHTKFIRINVYVVTADIATGEELLYSYAQDNTLVTTVSEVLSGQYLHTLFNCVAGIRQPWLAYGLASQVQENDFNAHKLETFYNKAENLEILDLFGARFYRSIDEKNVDVSEETAASLVKFIIDKYGKDMLCKLVPNADSVDMIALKNEWLKHIGVDLQYENSYETAFNEYIFTYDKSFDIVIIGPYATYNINMQNDKQYFLTSVENLEVLLYKNLYSIKQLLSLLKTIGANGIIDPVNIIYNIDESASPIGSYTDINKRIVYLHAPEVEIAHMHEAVHAILPVSVVDEKDTTPYAWLKEGLACYLTTLMPNDYSLYETSYDGFLDTDRYYVMLRKEIDAEEKGLFLSEMDKALVEYYISHGGKTDTLQEFNHSLFIDAIAFVTLKSLKTKESLYEINSYYLYESWVHFLAQHYSLEEILQAYTDPKHIHMIFNKSFQELIDDWTATLNAPIN